jgi:hypothetical protein
MNMLRAIAASIILWSAFVPRLSAQVRVTVPSKKFTTDEKIVATVQNDGDQPVTLCVASGQMSRTGQSAVSTPVPFLIEGKVHETSWKPLLVSPEGSGSQSAAVLEAKQSLPFPFWPPAKGELRLQLRYWQGAHPEMHCAHPPAGSHNAKPATFKVHAKSE